MSGARTGLHSNSNNGDSPYLSRTYLSVTPIRRPKPPPSHDSTDVSDLTVVTVYRHCTNCHVVIFARNRRSDAGFAPVGGSGIRGEER